MSRLDALRLAWSAPARFSALVLGPVAAAALALPSLGTGGDGTAGPTRQVTERARALPAAEPAAGDPGSGTAASASAPGIAEARALSDGLASALSDGLASALERPGEAPNVPGGGFPALVHPLGRELSSIGAFGDARPGGRSHDGIDLPSPKGTPVVAAASGRVLWLHAERGGRCCALSIEHDDGWRTRYIHLDNDTPGTDDGQGYGIREDLVRGSRVEAGDVIGWVGDSGNAENGAPHLHFEVRDPRGIAVDPAPLLRRAVLAGDAT